MGRARLEEGVVHGVSGMVGLQGGGGVRAFGWLDGLGLGGRATECPRLREMGCM